MVTKDQIVELLANNDKAVARALVVLFNRQTADEQATDTTHHSNGRGFNGADAAIGSSMAKFYMTRGFLSQKQVSYWRQVRKDGKMRIAIYANQLLEAAAEKEAAKTE